MLLQGIPEQIGIVTLAYALARIPFKWKEITLMGTVLALIAYVIRAQSLPFGIHTIVLIFALYIFLTLMGKKDVSISLFASLISYSVLVFFEFLSISLITNILNISSEEIFTDPVKRILFTEPQVILIFLTAFIIRRKRQAHD